MYHNVHKCTSEIFVPLRLVSLMLLGDKSTFLYYGTRRLLVSDYEGQSSVVTVNSGIISPKTGKRCIKWL